MKTPIPFVALLLTLAAWQSIPLLALGRELADGEREFVHQLVDRQLFELAESFCGEKLNSASDASERAEWELLLSECHLQHAWWMNDDSRNGMISLAVQRITEFLRTDTPPAEKDILLRVRQIELLAAAGIIEDAVRGSQSGLANRSSAPSRKPRKNSATTKFALDAIQQGIELAASLLKQIDQIRRDIDNDVVRSAREQIRLAQAQMLLVKARFSSESDAIGLTDQAGQQIEQLLKSTMDADLRFRARLLLAEMELDRRDFAAFDLRFTSLLSETDSAASHASAAALKIRASLIQDRPSEALQQWINYSKTGFPATPELRTLRLQSLLQMMELIYQLDESPDRSELIATTSVEFQKLKETTLAVARGVWRDRSLQIVARFERVQQVGPDAASQLEVVAALVEDGDLQEAREALHALIRRTGKKDQRLTAVFLLQSGDLGIRLREWNSAIADLASAVQFFQQSHDASGAAAADLLRAYAIGQKWNSDPVADKSEQEYLTALNEHIHTYDGQSTAVQAREWRARLRRTVDPLDSAEDLLQIPESVESIAGGTNSQISVIERKLDRLCLIGDLLLEAMAREPAAATASGDSDRLNTAVASFVAETMGLRDSDEAQGLRQLHVLEAQQLGLSLCQPLSTMTNWKSIDADAHRLLAALSGDSVSISGSEGLDTGLDPQAPGEAAPSPANASDRAMAERTMMMCHAMVVLASMRQLKDAADFEPYRMALVQMPYTDRLRTVQQLMRQLPISENRLPGDPQLAHLLIRMITSGNGKGKAKGQGQGTVEKQIDEFSMLNRLCAIVGNQTAAEEHLSALMAAPLTDSQLMQLADTVSRSTSSSAPADSSVSARRFWQSVQKRTKPGQDAWFEATLQIAQLADVETEQREALRNLRVVSVLHPDWGNPERKARAIELQMRLESSP